MIRVWTCRTAFGLLFSSLVVVALSPRASMGSIEEKIVNGSFEANDVSGLPNKFATLTPTTQGLAGWTIHNYPNSNSNTGIDLLYSTGPGDTNTWVVGAAADGKQFIDLAGSPGPGQISQTFATCVDQEYTLSFFYANNYDGWQGGPETPGQPNPPPNVEGISALVEVIGATLRHDATITHTSSFYNNLDWIKYEATFIADSNSTTLRFTSTGTNADFYYGLLLDKVSVTGEACGVVPEPMSVAVWSLLACCTGLVVRRRISRN